MSRRNTASIMDFFEKISLAQKIAYDDPHISEYVGSDVELAKAIAFFSVCEDAGIIDPETTSLIKTIMIEQNKATFASSEKTDIFSKLGLFRPKKERSISLKVIDDE